MTIDPWKETPEETAAIQQVEMEIMLANWRAQELMWDIDLALQNLALSRCIAKIVASPQPERPGTTPYCPKCDMCRDHGSVLQPRKNDKDEWEDYWVPCPRCSGVPINEDDTP